MASVRNLSMMKQKSCSSMIKSFTDRSDFPHARFLTPGSIAGANRRSRKEVGASRPRSSLRPSPGSRSACAAPSATASIRAVLRLRWACYSDDGLVEDYAFCLLSPSAALRPSPGTRARLVLPPPPLPSPSLFLAPRPLPCPAAATSTLM